MINRQNFLSTFKEPFFPPLNEKKQPL
jgi:hypothetical protein